jgi:hypothetical protein
VALQEVLDPAVEPLGHDVRPGSHRRCEAMLDPKVGAETVELLLARRGAAR